MDQDLWDCLRRVKLILQQNFKGTYLIIWSNSRQEKTPSYSQINMVHVLMCI